jgi:hypothetical protein
MPTGLSAVWRRNRALGVNVFIHRSSSHPWIRHPWLPHTCSITSKIKNQQSIQFLKKLG